MNLAGHPNGYVDVHLGDGGYMLPKPYLEALLGCLRRHDNQHRRMLKRQRRIKGRRKQ